MAFQIGRRNFIAASAASVGIGATSPAILTTGQARYHGLHLATSNAARRAIIDEMVATNRPLTFDLTGTYEIDRRIDLSAFRGEIIDLRPNCLLKSVGAHAEANVFYSSGATGVRIRGGILTPGSVVARLLHGHAIYFGNATDCWVEETVVEGANRGAIVFNGAVNCGWRDPVCRYSLPYADPPVDHSGLGYDFYLTGGISDFSGKGGLSYEGGGVGFSLQSLPQGGDVYARISLSEWRVVRALAYGAMLYRNSDAVTFKDISIYGDLIDTVYGSVPSGTNDTYVYGTGVYVQGVEGALAGAKVIRNTHANASVRPPTEQLAPGAIGLTNCTSGILKAELIENAGWYGITVRDPNGEGNPGKSVTSPSGPPGPDATSNGRIILDIGVIRNAAKASICIRHCPVVNVQATVENPREQALLISDPYAYVGQSLTERVVLERFEVVGGGAAGGGSTGVAAIQCSAGALEYRAGSVRGYHGLECIHHTSQGELILGKISLDASNCSLTALRIGSSQDPGATVAVATGSIAGKVLTVTGLEAGHLRSGVTIMGRDVMAGTQVVRVLTGSGGVGTYELDVSQEVASAAIIGKRPAEHSSISADAEIVCNERGQATDINRPLLGLEAVVYIGAGSHPDIGVYKRSSPPT